MLPMRKLQDPWHSNGGCPSSTPGSALVDGARPELLQPLQLTYLEIIHEMNTAVMKEIIWHLFGIPAFVGTRGYILHTPVGMVVLAGCNLALLTVSKATSSWHGMPLVLAKQTSCTPTSRSDVAASGFD